MIDDTQADAAVFNLDFERTAASDRFDVEPEAWPAVQAFLRCQTQWRSGPNGLVGLDYSALAWTFTLYEVGDPASVFADVQLMEREILVLMHDKEG